MGSAHPSLVHLRDIDDSSLDEDVSPLDKTTEDALWALCEVRLRPPRHSRPLPGVRSDPNNGDRGQSVKRRFLNLLTLVSLLFCLAVCVLWVRSYWIDDDWKYQTLDAPKSRTTLYGFSSDLGTIYVEYFKVQFTKPADAIDNVRSPTGNATGYFHFARTPTSTDLDNFRASFWNRRGFALIFEQHTPAHISNPQTYHWNRAMVPDWFVVLMLLLLSNARLAATNLPSSASSSPGPMHHLWLRPPRHPRPMPGMREGAQND